MLRIAFCIALVHSMHGCVPQELLEPTSADPNLMPNSSIKLCVTMPLISDTGETLRTKVGYNGTMQAEVLMAFLASLTGKNDAIEATWLIAYMCNAAILYANEGIKTPGVCVLVHPDDTWLLERKFKWFPALIESGKTEQWCPSTLNMKVDGEEQPLLPDPAGGECEEWIELNAETWHQFYAELDGRLDLAAKFGGQTNEASECPCGDTPWSEQDLPVELPTTSDTTLR